MDRGAVPAPGAAARAGNPFVGLRRFEIEDSDLFFGRNDQGYDLLRRLDELHFVAVIGPSGCGKSSLVRAGVLAALQQGYREEGGPWKIVTLQPGNAPLDEWTRALSPHLRAGASADLLVTEPLQALDTSNGRIVILIDQFEELFQFAERTKRSDEVVALIAAMLSTGTLDGRIYAMLTMRSEYLLQCAEHPELAAAINEGLYLVPRMTRAQMRQAIVGPIQMAGATITVELLERLLDDAEQEEDGLPVLQHALMRMWRHRSPFAPLGLDLYPEQDGLDALLDRHVDAVYQGLADKDKSLAQALFRCITELTRDGRAVRRARTLAAIAQETGAPATAFDRVIAAFRNDGFLTVLPTAGSRLIDIPHEAVARRWKRLVEWVGQAARQRLAIGAVGSAALDWKENEREKSFLFVGQKLSSIRADLGGHVFATGSPEHDFMAASGRADGWSRLRSPRVLAGIALVVIAASGALYQVNNAERLAREAESRAVEARLKAVNALSAATAARAEEAEKALAALSQARAAQTQSIEPTFKNRAPVSPVTMPRVYPQLWNAAQSRTLKSIIEKRQPKDYAVVDEQLVSVGPDTNEFRYFRRAEKATAERIAQDLSKELPLNVVYVAGYETSTKIRDNHFELWFAKPPAAAAASAQPVALVLYQSSSLRAGAQQIGDALDSDYGVSVRPYGAVSWNFVSPVEVHYFKKEDRGEAEGIAQSLKGSHPSIVARFMAVSQPIPNRYFEVWLQAQ